jgi:hypothetical protein
MKKTTIELKANEEQVSESRASLLATWELYKKQNPVKYEIKKANGEIEKSLAGK